MIINVSVVPGYQYRRVDTHKKIKDIFRTVRSDLQKQNGNPHMEIIIQLPNGEEFLRRKYPDSEKSGESPLEFCNRVEKEIKNIV